MGINTYNTFRKLTLFHKNEFEIIEIEKNPTKYMFCYIKENKMVKVEDDRLIRILSLKISKDLLK